MGQLIREDNPYSQKTCVYAYDSCGNILSRTEYGYTDAETPAGGTVTAYEYNNAAWGDQLTSWNGESITYDAIGNPLLYRGRSLTWTQGRRLAGVSSEGLAAYYTYDESGTRTGKTVNGVSTQYYINGSQILAQKSGEDILYFLYDETGAAVGFKYNNNLYIYRKNLQGDILAVLNGQTGAAEASYTYDAWGRVISSTGALAEINPFRYRGYYYDSETGLYYLQSRYYDPETGRFINADGYINTDFSDTNSYSYCGNCPVGYVDFCGHCRIRFDGVKLKDCHSFSCPYSEGLPQKEFESMLIAGIAKKPNFTPRKDPRKGSENRQPSGARERNKAHPDSEEHSRVPKGNNTGRKKFNKNDDDIMKEFWDNARYTWRIQRMWRWPWEEEFERNTPTGDLTFWEIINPFRRR